MLAKDRADSSSIMPDFPAHLDGNESCFLFPLLESNTSIFLFLPLFYFFILILSTHILGIWVNLESLSLVHLLSNFSRHLETFESDHPLKIAFPPSEFRSSFPRLSARNSSTTSLLSLLLSFPALPNPWDVHWVSLPWAEQWQEIQVIILQYTRLNSYIATVHTFVALTSALC